MRALIKSSRLVPVGRSCNHLLGPKWLGCGSCGDGSCGFWSESNNGTPSRYAIRANRTRTQSFFHGIRFYRYSPWTGQQWGTVLVAELDKYQILFPADWAVGSVLSAHQSRGLQVLQQDLKILDVTNVGDAHRRWDADASFGGLGLVDVVWLGYKGTMWLCGLQSSLSLKIDSTKDWWPKTAEPIDGSDVKRPIRQLLPLCWPVVRHQIPGMD